MCHRTTPKSLRNILINRNCKKLNIVIITTVIVDIILIHNVLHIAHIMPCHWICSFLKINSLSDKDLKQPLHYLN